LEIALFTSKLHSEMCGQVRSQWLMPIILATKEAVIRRIMVQSQPKANSLRLYLENFNRKQGLKNSI
jgi:hypothetical protein